MGDGLRNEPAGRLLDSNIPSTSTQASSGSSATPMVERAWRPASPKASTIRSEAPFMTGARLCEGRHGIDEAAEAHATHDLVEIAHGSLELSQQVDGAKARGLLPDLWRNSPAPSLPSCASASLPSWPRQSWPEMMTSAAGPHERHVVRHRRGRGRQRDAQFLKFLVDCAHMKPRLIIRKT